MKNYKRKKFPLFKARVLAVKRNKNSVEIAFIYYGSLARNIHIDKITNESSRYEKALKIRAGDVVYAALQDYDMIYHFHFNNIWKRWFLRFMEPFL